jgi:NAD(P)-dependent dehydrogenase (short-subunit alcohol dehydrogenase family)
VFPGPFEQTSDEQWANSIKSKGMGQINLVRAALPHIADKGSFTLISGVLTDEFMHGGTIGTTINHLVEGFVKAASVELPRGVRINCVSPDRVRGLPRLISPASPLFPLRKSRLRICAPFRPQSPGAS